MYLIPLQIENPRYTFQTSLDGSVYEFAVHWNETAGVWFADIAGMSNDVELRGLALVTGPNLLKPFALTELGALYVLDAAGMSDPTYASMGVQHQLYYVELSETDAII